MTNEIKAGSKILAEFEGYTVENETVRNKGIYNWPLSECKYHTDYNELMRVWRKFRDLELDGMNKIKHNRHSMRIERAICHEDTLDKAFFLITDGVEWYNSLKPKEEK